ALTMPVAGGEQDTSEPRFAWMARSRVVDVLQPDVTYNGGFIRTARVARLAAAAGLPCTPHSPSVGAREVPVLQFAATTENVGPFQEYHAAPRPPDRRFNPSFEVVNGALQVPTGPGLGIEVDPDVLRKAVKVEGGPV